MKNSFFFFFLLFRFFFLLICYHIVYVIEILNQICIFLWFSYVLCSEDILSLSWPWLLLIPFFLAMIALRLVERRKFQLWDQIILVQCVWVSTVLMFQSLQEKQLKITLVTGATICSYCIFFRSCDLFTWMVNLKNCNFYFSAVVIWQLYHPHVAISMNCVV